MKNKISFSLVLIVFLATPFFNVEAQSYGIMEAIPGFFEKGSAISFPDLISAIYKFGIWTVGIAALFMVTVGGFMYATSAGNTSSVGSAKTIIGDALLGIVVAMTAYLVLNLINPDLVGTSAFRDGLGLTTPQVLQPSVETADLIKNTGVQDLAIQILAKSDMIVLQGADNADCSSGQLKVSPKLNIEELSRAEGMTVCSSRCSNNCVKSGIFPPAEMLQAMLQVAQTKKYVVTSIAGGSHSTNNSAHYKGKAIDIVPLGDNWNDYVTAFRNNGANESQTFCEDPSTRIGSSNCEIRHHIHASFLK